MHRRTYEILAKWIGKKNGIKIVFEADCTPHANIKDKTITVPGNIKEENAYEALTTLMHEAAHIRHTDIIPEEFSKTPADHNIINVIEDVRIDNKNFHLLPNISDFYDRYYEKYKLKRDKQDMSKVPIETKVLINSIFNGTGFEKYGIQEQVVQDLDNKHDISYLVAQGARTIDYKDWTQLHQIIDTIKHRLGIVSQDPPKPEDGGGEGEGKEGEDDKQGEGGQGQEPKDDRGTKKSPQEGSDGGDKPSIKTIGFDEGGSSWDTTNQGGAGTADIGIVGLQEQTKARLKELLNIKEVRIIHDGGKLDTDNLTAFLTGNLEELFKDEKSEHKKCSKIMFLLDTSSSMGDRLLDGSSRRSTVAGACKEIIKVIEEVQSLEGLNVDWDIASFNMDYIPLDKENWEAQYMRGGGGTCIETGFNGAMDKMLKDYTIDGKRIIIMFSDGDVCESEIEEIKKSILRHGEDVRCVIIGVGSDINGAYSKEIIGERNILVKESADVVIMESVMECL